MAVDAAAVAEVLQTTVDLLPPETADEIAAVVAYADARYDAPTDPDQLAVYESTLAKQVATRLLTYRSGAAADDRAQRPVGRFDWDVKQQLSAYLKAGQVR